MNVEARIGFAAWRDDKGNVYWTVYGGRLPKAWRPDGDDPVPTDAALIHDVAGVAADYGAVLLDRQCIIVATIDVPGIDVVPGTVEEPA